MADIYVTVWGLFFFWQVSLLKKLTRQREIQIKVDQDTC